MQNVIVAIILTLSVAYTIYHVWRIMKGTHDPCVGCPGCAKKEARRKNKKNRHCTEKKS